MKRIIWSNYDVPEIDEEFFEENYPEFTEDERLEFAEEDRRMWLDDERENLAVIPAAEIVVLATIGTWRGPRRGYKLIQSGRISDCLYDDCDYVEWYCDGWNFRARAAHHDGENEYLYRAIRDDLTEIQRENFLEKLAAGDLDARAIRRYTVSLRPAIAEIYGWMPAARKTRKAEKLAA